jgi:hypothetical protein
MKKIMMLLAVVLMCLGCDNPTVSEGRYPEGWPQGVSEYPIDTLLPTRTYYEESDRWEIVDFSNLSVCSFTGFQGTGIIFTAQFGVTGTIYHWICVQDSVIVVDYETSDYEQVITWKFYDKFGLPFQVDFTTHGSDCVRILKVQMS